MTAFQSLALVGIFLVAVGSLVAAREGHKLRHEVREANRLLTGLLTTMRDRL